MRSRTASYGPRPLATAPATALGSLPDAQVSGWDICADIGGGVPPHAAGTDHDGPEAVHGAAGLLLMPMPLATHPHNRSAIGGIKASTMPGDQTNHRAPGHNQWL
ncbi:hypothetical protein TNCT6_67940 [Streptomyces sp. 6-11-2]|nr:hypothetical protein TNCT6_67940 [Streptomyces sp. 6-11-2]